MLNIQNFMDFQKTKEMSSTMKVHKYRKGDVYLVVFAFENLNFENIQHFVEQHERSITSKSKKNQSLIFGFDLSYLQNIDMKFLDTVVQQFEKNEDAYQTSVKCVYIYVKNELVVNIMKVVLNMYKTTVPLILTYDEKDIADCLDKYGC